jgi:hypothetical protein
MRGPGGCRILVFDSIGYKTLAEDVVAERDLLRRPSA